jgi:hypothetical protein
VRGSPSAPVFGDGGIRGWRGYRRPVYDPAAFPKRNDGGAPKMRKFGSLVSTILIVVLAITIPLAVYAAGKTHDMKVEIVSIDAKTKMITLKDANGENHTAPLLGKAIAEAKNFMAGDKVTATCQDNEKGEHTGVMALKKS